MDTRKMSKSALSRYYRYIRRYKSIAPKTEPEDAIAVPEDRDRKRIKIEKPDNGYEVDRRIARNIRKNPDVEDRKTGNEAGEKIDAKDTKVAINFGEKIDAKGPKVAINLGEKIDAKGPKVAINLGEKIDAKGPKVAIDFGEIADAKDPKIVKNFCKNTDEEDEKTGNKSGENTDAEVSKIAKKSVENCYTRHFDKTISAKKSSDLEKIRKSVADSPATEKLDDEPPIPKAVDDCRVSTNGYRRRINVLQDSSDEEEEIKRETTTAAVESSDADTEDSVDGVMTLYRKIKRKRRVAYPSDESSDDDFNPKRIKTDLSERSSSPALSLPERSASPEYDLPVKQKRSTGRESPEKPMRPMKQEEPVRPITQEEPLRTIKQEKPDKPIKQEKSNEPIEPEKADRHIKQEKLVENEPGSSKRDFAGDEKFLDVESTEVKRESGDSESDETASDTGNDDYDVELAPRRRWTSSDDGDDTNDEDYSPDEYDDYEHWDRAGSKKNRSLFKDNSFEIDPAFLMPKLGGPEERLGEKAQATLHREQTLTEERLKDLHGSLVARPVENERARDPRGLKVALMPHQQHALAWLQWREKEKPRGGVLADEMGLGKTLTMIALVMASIAKVNDGEDSENEDDWKTCARGQRHLGGTLVVVPASLLAQWEAEVKKRCKRDTITVEVYHGAKRETQPKRLAKNDIVITTYNIVCREYKMGSLLFKIRWRRVILDEAHVIRNHKSQPCVSVCALHTSKRWAVTGTPLHNKEMDLYSLLKFLQCSPFDDFRMWRKWVDNRNDAGHLRLATVMKTLMLRRTKEELQAKGELPPLPDKSVEVIEVALDTEERLIYDKVMLFSRTLFAQFLDQRATKARNFELGGGGYEKLAWNYRGTTFTKAQKRLLSQHADVQAHEILVLLIRLRQICCHPSLIKAMLDRDDIELQATEMEIFAKTIKLDADSDDEDEITDSFEVDERVTEHLLTTGNPVFDPKRHSSKMRAVISKIEDILDQGDKIIVVSQWVSVLNIVAQELDLIDGAAYRMFTGKVAVKDRQSILDDFNSESSEPNILLLSLTAGGVGLNVVGANHMLIVDIHWNPQLESQAQDRIHRFGQTKDVSIYKYICTDTIEERIQALQNKKLELARQVLSGTGKIIGSKLTLDDIKSLFGV